MKTRTNSRETKVESRVPESLGTCGARPSELGLPCVICGVPTGSVVDNFCADCRHVHFRAHDCVFAN